MKLDALLRRAPRATETERQERRRKQLASARRERSAELASQRAADCDAVLRWLTKHEHQTVHQMTAGTRLPERRVRDALSRLRADGLVQFRDAPEWSVKP